MKRTYIHKRLSKTSLLIIERANQIIDDYTAQGFRLTLRQLYYQFVSRDWIPNEQKEYDRLGRTLVSGRNAGLIDWNAIEDRTRNVRKNSHWKSPSEILNTCASTFRYDLWADQKYRPEVWIEKDALVGVFEPTCIDLDVPILSCRGYVSVSEMWESGRRFYQHLRRDQIPVILHFGDHDPSGIDMTRDLCDRLSLYAEASIKVERLALNMNQVKEYNPPPNPAKATDTRFLKYVELYGDESWELDALEPVVIAELIENAVANYRDENIWEDSVGRQNEARERLREVADNW